MILLRVGTDIVTYKDNQFQVVPSLQDPITQSEFEEHGIEPDVLSSITEEEWALFKQDFNAQTFTVIVFTTYEDEPELVYNINSKALLGLDFLGVVTHQISLDFQAEPRRKRRPKVVDSGPDVGVYVFQVNPIQWG